MTATTNAAYADPAAAGFSYENALGHLLVVVPRSFEPGVPTVYGERDAVKADIHDITAGETFEDTWIFPTVLVRSLRRQLGQQVLATLVQGVAKPEQSPPWLLLPPDESSKAEAMAAATLFLASAA